MKPSECCILNQGSGAWAFDSLASQLSQALGVDIAVEPRRLNYNLALNNPEFASKHGSFIPLESIHLAADKRTLASVFLEHSVPIPESHLIETFEEVRAFLHDHSHREWCLKYPTSCGANGHRLITHADPEPAHWPRPFIVQEFIRMDHPEVFRTYCAGCNVFGWMARRFPKGVKASPWVAHARGARYENHGEPPRDAVAAAHQALIASELHASFGCVDLLRRQNGEWLVLEAGTDGLFNHVDRDVDDAEFVRELHARIADAFWTIGERIK